ncbi:MAG: hypothetical protein V4437_01045 [Patescibacteria group bacterium]
MNRFEQPALAAPAVVPEATFVSYPPLDMVVGEAGHQIGIGIEVARYMASEHLLKILGGLGLLKVLDKLGIGFGPHRKY